MLSDAYDAIWNKSDQSSGVNSGYCVCQTSAVKNYVATTNPRSPLLFPDLVGLLNLIDAFQHNHALPELRYKLQTNSI